MGRTKVTPEEQAAAAVREQEIKARWAAHDAARRELRKWARVHAQRDELIQAAVAAGVHTRDIQEITGVARTTIARIAPGTRYRRPDLAE